MKTILFLFFRIIFIHCFVFFSSGACLAQLTWTEKNGIGWTQPASEVPYYRDYATGFSAGGKIYLGTGTNYWGFSSFQYYDELNEFNPVTGKWKKYFTLLPRERATGFSAGNKGYIGFGTYRDDSVLTDIWEFDPVGGTFSQGADFPDSTRMVNISFGANGKGYIGGGTVNDLWEFDPLLNTWTFIDTLPFDASDPYTPFVTFTIGANGYVNARNLSWKFDALSHTWSQVSPFPGASIPECAFDLLSMGYVYCQNQFYQYDPVADAWIQRASPGIGGIGGSDGTYGYIVNVYAQALKYDPVADSWSELYHHMFYIPYINLDHKNIALNNYVYTTQSYYDPASDQWTLDANLPGNGWLFAINNFGYAFKNNAFQKYDPITAAWTPLNPVSYPIGQTFTANGKGYSLLGIDSLYNFTPELYEYDPVSDSWTQKASFPGVNRDWARAFSISGSGYVVGGVDVNYSQTPEFWQYDPALNQWIQRADYPGYVDASDGFFSEELNGKGFVGLGGVETIGADDKIYCYDPVNDSWSLIAHPLGTRNGTVAFVVNNALYVGRGRSRMSMDFSFAYNDFWQLTDSLATSLSENPESNPRINLFPNPASDFINVSNTGCSEIKIYNSSGKIVYSEKLKEVNDVNVRINISSLSSGIYFLKTCSKRKSTMKFAVMQN